MHPTPQKVSIIKQTKAVLLEGMQSRRWQHILPGERVLSAELRVSRWTLRAALAELAQSGSLRIQHGRACEISPVALTRRRPKSSTVRVALLTPGPLIKLRVFVALWVDEIRAMLHEQNIALNVIDSVKVYQPRRTHALRSLVETHPHNAWLPLLSTRPMQDWFATRGLPTVIVGSRYDGIPLPALDIDFHAAGVHAGHTVCGTGHRRIGLLVPRERTAGIIAGESGLRLALSRAKGEPASCVMVTVADSTEEISQAVDRLLASAHPPTVFVASRANVALTVFSHLCVRGLRVPRDISLLALEWEPYLDYVTPAIARYELSPTQYAKRATRLLLHQLEANDSTEAALLHPSFARGASLAPPKKP